MTAKCTISYPTGLYIPVEKQASFMVAFEDVLVSNYNLVPFFGSAIEKNSCEVKFNCLGNKSYKPGSVVSNINKALELLKENMSILWSKKFPKRGRSANRFQTTPLVINLEDESELRTVDLTDGDPEVIVLEDSIIHTGGITRQSTTSSSVVDLTDHSESYKTPGKRNETDNYFKLLSMKKFKPQTSPRSTRSSEITVLNSLSTPKNCKTLKKKGKKRKNNNRRSLTRTLINSSVKSGSSVSLSSTDSLPRKKRKLQDISNIHSTASCSTSPSHLQPSKLSENTIKYYENISKVVGKTEKDKKEISTRNGFSGRNHMENFAKRKNEILTRKTSPIQLRTNKRKIFTPQNNLRHKDVWNHRRKFTQRSLTAQNSPRRSRRISLQRTRNSEKKVGETNAFNPNPFEVDLEGLRPIVIDGCNVAIGHGKGKFSAKGLKICVDYFSARGHTKIKIFLPQFRREEISPEILEALNTKCDVVFTPSQCINGKRRTSYDDRFIVQYATEFGGVIVSTDNFRDISRENPRWQDTIEKRLLMFTWVDDFLMFPVDPLGRSGPTLEEFLRF